MRLTEFDLESQGAVWLNGRDYGLEGRVLATCVALLLAAVVWVRPGRQTSERMFWEADDSQASEPGRVASTLLGDLPGGYRDSGAASEDRSTDSGAARRVVRNLNAEFGTSRVQITRSKKP